MAAIGEAMSRVETIGDCTLYLGDCREILPTLGKVDAVVTDPPYGIGEARNDNASRSCLAASRDYGVSAWDDKPITAETLAKLLEISNCQIIFGGNYLAVPPSSCWLVWDKKNGMNDFADCELAWTNLPKAVRRLEWQWHGMIRKGNEERFHPTQKPLGVMQWCLSHLPADCRTILDPFMGSGTTGVACVKAGLTFIGIEREEKYFDIACKRIEAATKEPRLPLPEPKMKQGAML
jgi:DNA modification methylase